MADNKYTHLEQPFKELLRRYGGATPEAFVDILCPILIPIRSIDPTIFKVEGQNHWRASFDAEITELNAGILCRGRTGKFVPGGILADSGGWHEIAKGRIIDVDSNLASGEIYAGGTKAYLERALQELSADDLLEIDQYGAAAKILSGLSEHALVKQLTRQGYGVKRMPEDMARHLGNYAHYDFEVTLGTQIRKVEVKSLWGTNTKFARLIHSTTSRPKGSRKNWTEQQKRNYYPTSSCKFTTQDIFAVSLFLRTGNISDFAFARSVAKDVADHGLPRSTKHPEHVNQNPPCKIGDGSWFGSIGEVWDLA